MPRLHLIWCLLVNDAFFSSAQFSHVHRQDSVLPTKRDNYTFDLPSHLAQSGNHDCILSIYQDLLNGVPSVQNFFSAYYAQVNTVRCLDGIQTGNGNTFFIEQPWDENFHHFEFRAKVVSSPNLNLYMTCPDIDNRMMIDKIRTPLHQQVNIDITAQIKRHMISNKAKCNITVSFSNALSKSQKLKQKATDVLSLLILSKKEENSRTPFREISTLIAVPNGRHIDEAPTKRGISNGCSREEMKVDLWRIGFLRKYVIHPATVDIGSCNGVCRASSVIEKNSSNRGVFLSLYQMTLGRRNPMTKCIPEKMKQMSVLHEDKTGVYVSYVGDIIIDSCVCQ